MSFEQEELISVIVPVYNVSKYIRQCLDSILNQTYTNLEIILIDDGSNDGSEKICDEYKNKDNRIQVIHQENRGLSAARNAGLDICKGKYIAFVDSDDNVNIHYIEILYNNLIVKNADISITDFRVHRENEKKSNYKEDVTSNNLKCISGEEKFENFYNDKVGQVVIACNKLYKKEIFDDLRFPVGKCHEDLFLSHHIMDKANVIVYTDAVLYYYYLRKGSITNEFSLKKIDEIYGMKDRMDFFNEKYPKTKYANLSKIAYVDKLIRIYSLCYKNRKRCMCSDAMKNIKESFDIYYVEAMKVTNQQSKKCKYILFKYFPKIISRIHFNKNKIENRLKR